LGSIIEFLGQLQKLDFSDIDLDISDDQLLIPVVGIHPYDDSKGLLNNVEHEIINNSIVVKSVLS
jgi:hypothetical protein